MELPFYDLGNLPTVVITFSNVNETVHEAKVDMNNIRRVRYFMERGMKCPVYGHERPY